ncbi:MAG: alkaline phosphatase family protein [Rhodoferax sp.]|jgi:predicted AlkP superfamily pyrophosphatase or phosphodiesterase|nr:alkaline phosphatase family protein [Rhodoferax sp.]MCL4738117.1 alkaline phosphatase family protein [Burkholderiaceae bacterium]MCP5290242.1 alkaline phosphatase family protein [Burkholderiaceae bacterium]
MTPTLVLDVVGLTPSLLAHAPHLAALARTGAMRPLQTVLPAVTTTVQSTLLTGLPPAGHGIVGNGWYFRDLSEVWLWRQSNRLVGGDKIWDAARRRDPTFSCAQLFWWYNMYADVDVAVTPRPMYLADGRKLPDIHTHPAELRDRLQQRLGTFPLFRFWGPAADIVASRWIADCALQVFAEQRPTLTLVYLPHLDYDLQRLGPNHPGIPAQVAAVDALCAPLIDAARRAGAHVVALSEYGITEVSRPVHVNRALREAGWLKVRVERGREQLDAGASDAFAVADHQIAHVYVRQPELIAPVARMLATLPGVEAVLDEAGKYAAGLAHERAGELVAVSAADSWFTYYYWLDDARAPDFARTVDIHRKPGYDPVELFLDPQIRLPRLAVASRLARKAMGFRTLMDVIGLDAGIVRGSHGRPTDRPEDGPLIISSAPGLLPESAVQATAVKQILLDHLFPPGARRLSA